MIFSEDRILTTHTGSLPRPAKLIDLFLKRQRGEPADPVELARLGDEAVRTVIARQQAAGIDIGNNGEQGRDGFFRYIKHRMSGFDGSWNRPPKDYSKFPAYRAMRAREAAARAGPRVGEPAATGAIRYHDRQAISEECTGFAAALLDAGNPFAEAFVSAPSPGIVATAMQNRFYDSEAAYLAAIGAALKVEYEAIVGQGFILQIDAPDLALEASMAFQHRPVGEFLAFAEQVVATINDALVDVPRDRVRLHVCWGNSEAPHDADIPLAEIMPILLKAKVSAFVLPFASPAHAHEYRVLEHLKLADDQAIVAGVIDTVTNVIEHPEAVADRIERIAAAVGDPRRVMAGTDCGFETSPGSTRVTEDIAWAKLANLAEGARIASARLFPRLAGRPQKADYRR